VPSIGGFDECHLRVFGRLFVECCTKNTKNTLGKIQGLPNFFLTRGKQVLCQLFFLTLGKEASLIWLCFFWHSAVIFFLAFSSNVSTHNNMGYSILKIGNFFVFFIFK
jgi:hypothetical protein